MDGTDGSTHHRRRATIPLSNKSFDDIEGCRGRNVRVCTESGKPCEMLSEEEAPLLTGYRGIAGSHVGHYQPRRESILFRPSISDSDSSPLSLSRKISANSDLLPEDLLITPFAQILHTLRNVRNSFVTLNETCTPSIENSQNGALRDISDGESSKMAVETLEDLDWCLEQLEKVQTHRSVSDMATTKFKRILSRELNQFSETGSSASEVSEYINSTFLEKYKDLESEMTQNHVIVKRKTSSSEEPRDEKIGNVTVSRASSVDSSISSHDNDNFSTSRPSSNQMGRKQLCSVNRHVKTSLVVTLDPNTLDDLQLSTHSASSSLSTSPSSNQAPPSSSSSSSSTSSSSSSNQNAPQSGRSLSSSSSSAATIVPSSSSSSQHHHHHHPHHQQPHHYHHHYHQSKASRLEPILERACDWSFDVFHLADVTSNRPLLVLTNYIFEKHNLLKALNVPTTMLLNFLNSVEQNYNNNNSYHNNIHATDVVQSAYCLLNTPSIKDSLSDIDIVATIIAAAVHDIDHPGVTNQYLINSELDLAILYNDRSVLENHHLAVTFTILKDKEVNIFQNLQNSAYRNIRRMIIDMVLATDMSLHLKLVADLKTMVETQKVIVTNRGRSSMSPQPSTQPPLATAALAAGVASPSIPEHRKILLLDNQEDKMQVLQTLVHCADLGNPAKHITLFRQWVDRIMREFFHQGDLERDQGLDISPMCNRDMISVEKAQVGFIDYIALPLWEAWDELVNHEVQDALDNLLFNRDWFESQEKEKVKGACVNN